MKKFLLFLFLVSALFGEKMGSDFVEFLIENNYKLGATRDKLVKCDKDLNGIFYVKDRQHILFMPDIPFTPSTKLRCDINGEKILYENDDFFVSLENKDNSNFILYFNDDVNANVLRENLKIKTEDKKNFLDYEISKIGNIFIVNIINPSEKNYTLTLDGRLKSVSGKKLKKSESVDVVYKYKDIEYKDWLEINKSNIEPISLENKQLGIRVYFEGWIYGFSGNEKYVKVSDDIPLKVSSLYFDNDKRKYYTDITSSHFKANTKYKITFKEGFGGEDDAIKEDFDYEFVTKNYEANARFSDDKPYLSSKGVIGISTVNIKQIDVIVSKISDDNIRYFINFNHDKYKAEQISKKTFDIDYMLNEEIKSSISIGDFKDGIYLVELVYKNDEDKLFSIEKVVYLSDIAINTKLSQNEVFVFLNRLSEDSVVSGAKVSVYSSKNKLLASGVSDEFGIFKVNQKDIYKQEPKSVYVELSSEKNFLSFDNFYEYKDIRKRAFIYLASDILTKQDELKGVVIVKQGYESIKNLPIRLEIFDPNGKKIISRNLKLDEYGTIKLEEKNFDLSGKYTIKTIFENDILNEHSFFVEAFVPQRIKNHIEYEKNNYFITEPILANLSANYLVGGFASNLSGTLKAMLVNAKFKPNGYEEYSFTNQDDNFDKILFEKEYGVYLDDDGKATQIIKPFTKMSAPSIYNLKTLFMINDNGKNVATYKQVDIYPYESMVGVKLNKGFYNEKEDVVADFVTINPKLLQKTHSKINAKLYRQNWSYNYNGWYLNWVKELVLFSSYDDIKNNKLRISNLSSGSYVLVVQDSVSTHKASVCFEVSGYNYGVAPTDILSKATIKLDKKEYKKGDTINATISSPLKKGLMIVTLEENGIKDYKIANIINHSANVSFDIKEDFKGMYLKASILRIADKPSTFIPFKATSEVYIAKDESSHKILLNINAPKIVKSGESFKVDIDTKPDAKIYLFVVDEGVLNIVNQKSPNPFEFFKVIYHSLVDSYDIYDLLTNYEGVGKVLSFGGDIMLKNSLNKYQDPKESKKEQNFIKMFEAVSDSDGKASFDIDIKQDFNTKLRLDVIALKDDLISSASGDVVIKDDFMIKGANISYLLEGDEVVLPLRVFNNTENIMDMSLDVSSNDVLDINEKHLDINLNPNQNKSYNLTVKALERGKAEIYIKNTKNDKTTLVSFDILSPHPPTTIVKSGFLSKLSDIEFEEKDIKLSISKSPEALLFKDQDKLIKYPYGCSEQRSSKLLAMLSASGLTSKKQEDRISFINLGIKALLKQQKPYGAFGYFSVDDGVHKVASIYATYVLSILQKEGFDVDKDSLDLALSYLKSFPLDGYSGMFASFVLSENDMLDTSSMNALYDNDVYKYDITTLYMMASMLKKANKDKELSLVFEEIKNSDLSYKSGLYRYDIFSSYIKNLGFALYIHSKYFKDDDMGERLLQSLMNVKDKAYSTQERAFLLLSFKEYFKNAKDSSYTLKNGSEIYNLSGDSNLELSLKENKITIDPKNSKLYYSGLYNTYKPLENNDLNIYKNVAISRTFVNSNGEEIDLSDIKLNDLIFAKIAISTNNNYKDVLIHEKAPSCFEIVNERIINNVRNEHVRDNASIYHKEINDYSITTFLSSTPAHNEAVFYTPYKVVLKGKCKLPVVTTERMYDESMSDYYLNQEEIIVK